MRDAPPNKSGVRRHPPPHIPHSPGNHHVFSSSPSPYLHLPQGFSVCFHPERLLLPGDKEKAVREGSQGKSSKGPGSFTAGCGSDGGGGLAGGLLVCAASLSTKGPLEPTAPTHVCLSLGDIIIPILQMRKLRHRQA